MAQLRNSGHLSEVCALDGRETETVGADDGENREKSGGGTEESERSSGERRGMEEERVRWM